MLREECELMLSVCLSVMGDDMLSKPSVRGILCEKMLYVPSSRPRNCEPPCITGPSSSFCSARVIDSVPVREYPAPMTWMLLDLSVGFEGSAPIVLRSSGINSRAN
jgi:hypothetical protein